MQFNCVDCGQPFTISQKDQNYYAAKGWKLPKRCKPCRARRRQLQAQAEQEQFLSAAGSVQADGIQLPSPGRTLYVIGNGFDLCHGVQSQYRCFRDHLSRRNPSLLDTLELWIRRDDLWSDFEGGLSHIDGNSMCRTIGDWMEDFDAYDPDGPAANLFLAVEAAAGPMHQIVDELPEAFRRWVNTLQPAASAALPFRQLLAREGRYLCFNYTEFLERLYGISRERILYIHGCRTRDDQELILGHAEGDGAYGSPLSRRLAWCAGAKDPQKLFDAQGLLADQLAGLGGSLEKKARAILQRHAPFFRAQRDVTDVVVIGHSLSPVDWPYFEALKQHGMEGPVWHISWHGPDDLQRIFRFAKQLGLGPERIELFRL